jgi:tellurite resistance protein TehA-like permease
MATGGIATLISIQPHPFPGLITIGAVFFIINLFFFFGITVTMILRFTKFPGSFKASITHEREGLFLGPFFLSVATIITGTQKYIIQAYEADHPNRTWAVTSIAVAFWVYTFAAFCLATFQYSFLFCCHTYKLTSFMPSWLLPVFPVMLSGTIASVIAADQPVATRMPIIVAGLGCQGLGFTMAIIMYAHYIGRLMQVGYPGREHRGAMFIGVGPPSFTILALIGMSNALPDDFDLQGDGLIDAKLLRTMALVIALFLWVLAMWFFMITLVAVSLSHASTLPTSTDIFSGHSSMGSLLPLGMVGNGVPQHWLRHRHHLHRHGTSRRNDPVHRQRPHDSHPLHVGVRALQSRPSRHCRRYHVPDDGRRQCRPLVGHHFIQTGVTSFPFSFCRHRSLTTLIIELLRSLYPTQHLSFISIPHSRPLTTSWP